MSEQQKAKKRFSLRKLIYNDKNLIIISLLAAVCIWIATSMNLSPETTKNISVPLKIDFSDTVTEELGFKCYGESSMTVNVTVRAKKYLAKDISADDLDVKLQTSSVTTTGIHEVPISVSAGDSGDFTVESYYPTVYTGYFDVPEEQEMEIKLNYNTKDYVADGFVAGESLLNEPNVVVSGPKTYVARVSKVVADVNLNDKLSETATINIEPKAVDVYGNKVDYISLNYGAEKLTLTIPVLKVKQLSTHVTLTDAPESVDLSKIKIYYSTDSIRAGVLAGTDIKAAELGEVHFTDLRVGENTFTFNATQLEGITVLDDTEKVTVRVVVPSDYTSKDIDVSAAGVKLNNVPAGYTAKVTALNSDSVTIIGPKSAIRGLKAKNVMLSCDLTAKKGEKSLFYVVHTKTGLKHQTCLECHTKVVAEKPDLKKDLTGCAKSKCHP